MSSKEKAVVVVLGTAILGAIAYLLLFAPLGSLGSADGQSYEVDRFSIIGYLVLFLVVGFFVVRWQSRQGEKEKVDILDQGEGVWPPAPEREEPGTGSTGF